MINQIVFCNRESFRILSIHFREKNNSDIKIDAVLGWLYVSYDKCYEPLEYLDPVTGWKEAGELPVAMPLFLLRPQRGPLTRCLCLRTRLEAKYKVQNQPMSFCPDEGCAFGNLRVAG